MGQRAQTHCKWGHPFDARNTYYSKRKAWRNRKPGTFRRCRACSLADSKEYDVYRRKTPKKKRR